MPNLDLDPDAVAKMIKDVLAEQGATVCSAPWDLLTGSSKRPYRDAADAVLAMLRDARRADAPEGRRRPERGPARVNADVLR